jgi:hypothetical protein
MQNRTAPRLKRGPRRWKLAQDSDGLFSTRNRVDLTAFIALIARVGASLRCIRSESGCRSGRHSRGPGIRGGGRAGRPWRRPVPRLPRRSKLGVSPCRR